MIGFLRLNTHTILKYFGILNVHKGANCIRVQAQRTRLEVYASGVVGVHKLEVYEHLGTTAHHLCQLIHPVFRDTIIFHQLSQVVLLVLSCLIVDWTAGHHEPRDFTHSFHAVEQLEEQGAPRDNIAVGFLHVRVLRLTLDVTPKGDR